MAHQVTVTAKTGPDRANTALVIPNVSRVDFDLGRSVVQIYDGIRVREHDLTGVTAVAITITAGQYAVVIS